MEAESKHHKKEPTRVLYEKKPEVRLKRYIKNHDPVYVKKRREYSKQPDVKERRQNLNKRRRQLCSTLIHLCKQNVLTDINGNVYSIDRGRLVQNGNQVLKINKSGLLVLKPFSTSLELENDLFDEPVVTEEDKEFLNMLDDYHSGVLTVEMIPKPNLHINVNVRREDAGDSSGTTTSCTTGSESST